MNLPSRLTFKPTLKSFEPAARATAPWLALGLLVVVGIVSTMCLSKVVAINDSKVQLRWLLVELQETVSALIDAETGQRGYLLTGAESYLEPYQAALRVVDQRIDHVEQMFAQLPDHAVNVDALRPLVAKKLAELSETIRLRRDQDLESALEVVRSNRGKELMDEVRRFVERAKREISDLLTKKDQQLVAIAARTQFSVISGNVLAAILFGSVVFLLRRELAERKRIERHARELTSTLESTQEQTLLQLEINTELEKRVGERTAQLEAANKELEAFSYSVSHDLRAPLRAIDGFSRIVVETYGGPLPDDAKRYLQLVRENTRQMGQLVDDLLAFSRLSRQAINKHPVDPQKIVNQCLAELLKEQDGRKVEVVVSNLCPCKADPALLKQVWTNLLSNALKYTRKQKVPRIEVGCRAEPRLPTNGQPPSPPEAEVVYFVKDNGAGFDMKYAHKLFGVFQRLHRAADYEGTGVGLAIVQRIVHRHGGRVWGEAQVNQGATFSFTLE